MAKIVHRPEINFLRKFYIKEVILGLFVTLKHVIRNLFFPEKLPTVFYPEEKKEIPLATRGRHRLMKREDGTPRCTACMLCATNCPAFCIHIKAAEVDDPYKEKYPEKFDIDLLRCVFCGLCVEACPLDAIRMDMPLITFAEYKREDFVLTKEILLDHDNEDYPHAKGYNPPKPLEITHGIHHFEFLKKIKNSTKQI
ncbi:MAG: NADH-quinone oxidoreductase subunit I [Candidatus Omnitrophica bacterium]|nr:NADH-quinone oxidoreductase subunit I [Candidatus Omnitrophota bacterium]